MSNSHGGFDDDVPTMNSVMRRVIGADDATAIVNYFQEPLQPLRATALAAAPAAAGKPVRLEAALARRAHGCAPGAVRRDRQV